MIAKNDIASGAHGIVLPWRLVRDFDTSASSGIGAPVYLSETPGTSEASNLTFTAPTGDTQVVVVGRVTVDATAANGGAMLINPSAPETKMWGGVMTAAAGVPPRQAFT